MPTRQPSPTEVPVRRVGIEAVLCFDCPRLVPDATIPRTFLLQADQVIE